MTLPACLRLIKQSRVASGCWWTAAVLLLSLAPARRLLAQNVVVLRANSGGRVQVAPGATLMIPLVIDMSAAGGLNLGALAAGLAWNPTRLAFDSVTAGGFGVLVPNTGNAAAGSISLATADLLGTTSTATMANVFLTASATPGATTVSLSPTLATAVLGGDLLGALRIRNLGVCVAPTGPWGDVNSDNDVNIVDAQQIARASVGLSVLNLAAIATQGDVTNDGAVNIIDAQQIARFSVGLSAPARINASAFTPPVVTALSVASVLEAAAGSMSFGVPANTAAMAVGTQAQILPLARDAASTDVTSCAAISYSSNSGAVTVSADGLVSAMSPGASTVTLTAGSATTQVDVTVTGVIAHTYSTDFPLTENPISDGGRWINGGVLGLDWSDVSSEGGFAIGHQTGPNYTDATALLTGVWGPDQTASGTVFARNQNDPCYQEFELRLRSAMAPHVNTGYEISFKSSQTEQAYLIIVRWNGPLGDFTELFDVHGAQFAIKDGDVMSASVIGNVITAYKNGVQMAQVTDNTFTTGNPGIGFNLVNDLEGCRGTNGDYGFTHYTVTDGAGLSGVRRAGRLR